MDPPPCIQNAMLTKDKKPFTYTPGGLNLSEIRSPRMARRIEKNAAYEGIGAPSQQPGRSQVPISSLPPSTVAAMQPQMHVQVFPSGPPPPINQMRGGVPPPPPPPPCNLPSARIPTEPLPTQKVRTADQQIVERPDMTKIIPENPMAMLRKTGGPKIKNALLDEIYREGAHHQQPSQNSVQPTSPKTVTSPQVSNAQPVWSPSIQNAHYQPTNNPVTQQQPQYPPNQHIQYQQQVNMPVQQPQLKSPPIIQRNVPTKKVEQQSANLNQPAKVSNVGSIYIPPLNTEQNKNEVASPPTPQSPRVQTPGTPTLKDAPKPWQQKQQKKEQVPEWAKRESEIVPSPSPQEYPSNSPNTTNIQQLRWPQNNSATPQQYQSQETRKQPDNHSYEPIQRYDQNPPKTQMSRPLQDPASHPNAVFVTQPIILQHPGNGYGPPVINRRENINVSRQEGNAVIIPIQVEGAEPQNRNFGRQQSWSNNPMQSGSFRVIQKVTGTDDDDVDSPTTEHSPKFPKQFSQEQGTRKNLHGNNDNELSSRFKQVPNDAGVSKPQVRNIPIQIEGGNAPSGQYYVPPSQQTPAEEPKKYTGSSIPSRSFKMLQAMTASDSCANAKEANETNENSDYPYHSRNWAFPYAYPIHHNPQHYWPPFYPPPHPYEIPQTEHSNSDPELNKSFNTGRRTPFPFGVLPPNYIVEMEQRSNVARKTPSSFSRCSSTSELEHINSRKTPVPQAFYSGRMTPAPRSTSDSESDSNRNTPLPFWHGYPPQLPIEIEQNKDENFQYYPPPYTACYDPYYFHYYYGYPPIFSPLPFMYPNCETEDVAGYSSMDEMTYYNGKSNKSKPYAELSTTPEIVITPTHIDENVKISPADLSHSDSDTDTEVNEDPKNYSTMGKLQTIKSVQDINIYKNSDEETEPSEDDEDSDISSISSSVEEDENDEPVPHQLSVIFEVSERTETPRNARECSVASDCTTVEAKSDEENEDDNCSVEKQWIANNLMEIASRIQNSINARIKLDDLEESKLFLMEEENKFDDRETNHCHNFKDFQEATSCAIIPNKLDDHEISTPNLAEKRCEEKSNDEKIIQHHHDNQNTTADEETSSQIENKNSCAHIPEVNADKKPDELETVSKESSDSEDWWGVIGKEEDDLPVRRTYAYNRDAYHNDEEQNEQCGGTSPDLNKSSDNTTNVIVNDQSQAAPTIVNNSSDIQENPIIDTLINSDENENPNKELETDEGKLEITSAHSSHSSASSRKVSYVDSDESPSSESEDEESSIEEEVKHDFNNNEQQTSEETTVVIPTIKERIRALQESIAVKKKSLQTETEIKLSVSNQTSSIESKSAPRSKTVSAKSSLKSFDEISEEDSGVTDLSSQFLDNEEFPELKKMNKYQRASTHSRLFQLLQEECENDSEEVYGIEERKNQLSLPLIENANDTLANELVQSMLKQKGAQIFRNMSMDKLHAAAKKILQEDNESFDTPSEGFSEFLSPMRNDTGNSTPQEFYGHYNEYIQYYDSWAQASALQEHVYDSAQTKVPKNIQNIGKPSYFSSSIAKCPRVLSGKNVHSDLMKLVECPEEVLPVSTKIPDLKS